MIGAAFARVLIANGTSVTASAFVFPSLASYGQALKEAPVATGTSEA